jgi:DUF4097 and DUF4098 domain-containing protein YvlB
MVCASQLFAQDAIPDNQQEPHEVQSLAADPGVVITICLKSGNIAVVGSDRRDVRVVAEHATQLNLRPADGTNPAVPATRLEVFVGNAPSALQYESSECRGTGDLDLEVPNGATIYVKTQDGDIEVSNVEEVRAETSIGSIGLMRIGRAVEASTVSGDISLEDSYGRISLRSISGSLEAVRTKVVEPGDFLIAKTIDGDVGLEQIEERRVEASSISGDLSFLGPLAPGGFYNFKTTTGDITLSMPDAVSFQVTAKVSQGGEVSTEFPLKYVGGMPSRDAMSSGRLTGRFGAGADPATLNLVSFSGTVRLRRK